MTHSATTQKHLSGEDKVVIFVSLFTLSASVLLYIYRFPPTMAAIFLATGITSWVYRFLGGIQGATFRLGALKLGGTFAA